MTQFLVIAFDPSERQPFYDVVPAGSSDEAIDRVLSVRGDYALIVDAILLSDFERMASSILNSTAAENEAEFQGLASQK